MVVFVDDVQWGDVDSAGLLVDLVRPPDAPPLLLVMTYRDDMADTSPFLIDLRSRHGNLPARALRLDCALTHDAYGPPSPEPVLTSLPANPSLPPRYALQMAPSDPKTGYPAYSLTLYERPVRTGFFGSDDPRRIGTGEVSAGPQPSRHPPSNATRRGRVELLVQPTSTLPRRRAFLGEVDARDG